MPICATAVAVGATDIGPHAKLVLILISDALDQNGHFECRFLEDVRGEARLDTGQFRSAMAELFNALYYTAGHTSELGEPAYHFNKLVGG